MAKNGKQTSRSFYQRNWKKRVEVFVKGMGNNEISFCQKMGNKRVELFVKEMGNKRVEVFVKKWETNE